MIKQLFSVLILGVFSSVLLVDEVKAEQITLKAKDDFPIQADYIKANTLSLRGVLMLHQCNEERSMYAPLAEQLASNGFHSLRIDFRGFGESLVDGQSIQAIRAKATSRKHYFEMTDKLGIGKHRSDDVQLAYEYLADKIGDGASISIIGASCGGAQAVLLAQKFKLDSFIFFSAAMSDKIRELFNKVSDVPALIIAAEGDGGTYTSLTKAFQDAKSSKTRLLAFKGNGHGKPLFKEHPDLQNTLVEWFKANASK